MLLNKPLKICIYFFEYIAVRVLEFTVSCLPRRIVLLVGAFGGLIAYLLGIRRKVIMANMRHVGLWNEKEMKKITRNLYKNTGRYFADFLLPPKRIPAYSVENYQLVESCFSRGKGIIALLAHFGSWEMMASIFGKKIKNLYVISKPMKNTFIEQWLTKKRLSTGVIQVYANNSLRKILEVLKSNGLVAMLIDQNAGPRGTPVSFLGKTASTTRAVAGIFYKTDCSVLAVYALLKKDGTYKVHIHHVQELEVSPDTPDAFIEAYQYEHNRILSQWIEQNPDHWFGWFHRRFRGYLNYSKR